MTLNAAPDHLTSLQQIVLTDPSQRFILWIISSDPKAFSSYFFLEIMKRQDLLNPNGSPNLAKALTIFDQLKQKGMIDVSDPLKTKISWKGQFYRIYTHPSQGFWIGIIGIFFAIVGIITCNKNADKTPTQDQQRVEINNTVKL